MSKKIIVKKDWLSNFTLIGRPQINDFTFKSNEKNEEGTWQYNSMNLGVDCGEKYGVVYAEMMGGYNPKPDAKNVIYAHGKNEDGTDDFESKIEVDWDDRFNDEVLETIGDLCFITVGLEKTDKGTTYYKKFLSTYDAIDYISKYINSDTVVNVKGNLKYSTYKNETQVRKNITSIVLSKVDDASKFNARFTQSILIDKSSANLKNIDKDKSVMFVDATVLDYVKEINGAEVKGQFPLKKQFEFPLDLTNEALCKKIMDKLFKVKKDITQITFEGELIEGGSTVMVTWDDVPQDIKDLVEIGAYTKEEAITRCSSNGSREQRMLLLKPQIRLVGEGDNKTPVVQRFDNRYTEDDLYLDYVYENDNSSENTDDNLDTTNTESTEINGLDWLNQL